jgi:hypothetical protein
MELVIHDRWKFRRASPILNQTELVILGIGHHNDHAVVVLVSFAGEPSAQRGCELDRLVDVVNADVKMYSDFAHLWFPDRLEDDTRLRITATTEIHPAFFRRARIATEQSAPEPRHSLRVKTVNGDSGPNVRHRATLRCPHSC